MALDRKAIVAMALEILQRDGLEGVTLRRLAAGLGIKAASLYWHVKDKRELLSEMAEEMLASRLSKLPEPKPGQKWQDWFKGAVRNIRKALLSYRDGGLVAAGVNPRRANTYARLGAHLLTVLVEHYGFNLQKAGTLIGTAFVYAVGSVIEEQTSPTVEELRESGPSIVSHLSPRMQRRLARAAAKSRSASQSFDEGLDLIIRGVK